MKKLILIFSLMLILATSCATDEPVLQEKQEATKTDNAAMKVSENDAVKVAEFFMGQIASDQTRASQRKVSQIAAVLNNASTRGETSDTLLYIINYENAEGYAIVSADKRAYPVFAISDTGFFEINDETNEGVIQFLENAKETVAIMVENNENPMFIPGDVTDFPGLININRKIGPLISERQRRVGNCPELNKYCRDENGNHMWTCCVPIAVEIAMSYHKWPKTLEGEIFDWDKMNAGLDDDGIARLLGILSSKDYCQVHYSEKKGYYSFRGYIQPTLKKCHYNTGMTYFATFTNDEDKVKYQLLNYGPIIIDGRAWSEDGTDKGGHAWIIDGYDYILYPGNYQFPNGPKKYQSFYHCVWGNPYGGCNGYYLAHADKYFDGAPDLYDPTDAGNNNGEEYWHFSYYDGAFLYLGDFKPSTE